MATMTNSYAFQATSRFGLGARPGELDSVGSDPRGWLLSQLHAPFIPQEVKQRFGGENMLADVLNEVRKNKLGKAQQKAEALREIYINETGARMLAQIRSTQPFIERMVLFWSNHFTISIQKPILAGIVNQYEVEAIRPHINGTFRDMLIAVTQHPGMLLYLDNAQSFGPDSRAGKRRDKGINENLAREILELHTLGVGSGYTQADVIALARIITGWTLDRSLISGIRIAYKFQHIVHEPGNKILLGHNFSENGEQEGIDALTMLARHSATARHIATKLARHFIDDNPPPSAIAQLEKSFLDSDGHLPTIMRTLVNLNDAWTQPLTKFKTPYEYMLSALRLTAIEPNPMQVVAGLEALNFRAFNASSPAGYDDLAASWASSDAILKRIEWGHRLAQRLPASTSPLALAEAAIGDYLSPTTKQAIERAPSGVDGIGLLLASPEFQRR